MWEPGEQWLQRLGLLGKLRQPIFQKDRNLHALLLLKCIQELYIVTVMVAVQF